VNWIIPIYITPIFIAIAARTIWWVFFSQESDQLLASEPFSKDESVCLIIVFWPFILTSLVFFAVCWILVSPFILLRKLRLKGRSHEQLRS
jgi:hypothetical protein